MSARQSLNQPLNRQELEITHVRGSGPGGQNRNKRWTGVRVVHLPTGIEVVATERRSQAQNMDAALERLQEKLARHFHKPKKRRPTKPTKGSKERRVTEKKGRGCVKSMRKKPGQSDW